VADVASSATILPERPESSTVKLALPVRSRRLLRSCRMRFQRAHPAFVAGAPGLDALANPHLFLRQLFVEQLVGALLGQQCCSRCRRKPW
jgi:hypothetical protein